MGEVSFRFLMFNAWWAHEERGSLLVVAEHIIEERSLPVSLHEFLAVWKSHYRSFESSRKFYSIREANMRSLGLMFKKFGLNLKGYTQARL